MAQDLVIKVVGDTKDVEKAFKRTSTASGKLEKDLIRVGKRAAIAVGALGVAAGATSIKLIKMAGDAEEVRSKFKVTFQNEMPRMISQLDAFSKATGASRYQLRQQAADLGALLVPLVGSRREAANLSVGFTKLATDLSSFNNVPVDEALQAIRAGLVGEAEPLRRFGVLLNEAAVKAEAYRSGLAKSGAVLTETQKVQARANLIMQQTTLAQGDATRTSGSFTNQLRRFQNQVRDAATDLGTKLLPLATDVLNALNKWGPILANRIQPHLDRLGQWAQEHREEFRKLFLDAAKLLERMAVAANAVAENMGGWAEAFKLVLSGAIAVKLAGILGLLAGPGGKGGGILGAMTKLKGLGPISLVVALTVAKKSNLDELAEKVVRERAAKELFGSGVGALGALTGRGVGTALRGSVQLPTSFKSTHQTSGLADFPAVDIFGKAGSPVLAPENGRIVSIRPFNSNPDFYGMAIYYLGASGATYYIKHIFDPSPIGNYKRGDVLGKIAAGTSGGPHVHFGKRSGPGVPIPISNAASPGGVGGVAGGTAGSKTGGTAPKTTVQPLIPAGMRLALSKAEGTKNLGDDLVALRAMVAYLQKLLPKTKDVEKRIEIQEALNGLRDRITEISKTGKKADIKDAIDYEALKAKLREQFREGIEQARQRVVDARSGFAAAFGILSDQLVSVFDAKTERMIENLRVKVAGFDFTIGAGEETPAEAQLRALRERKSDQALQDALANAKTVEEIATAQAAIEEDALEKRARAERAAADASLATETERLRDQRELQKRAFNQELADLQEKWAKTSATTEQRTRDLNQLMAKFDIPFQDVGSLLGTSFANGFLDSMQIVFDRLADLARELNKITPSQAAEAVILAGGTALAARSAALNAKYGLGSLPQFQKGGIVPGSGPQLAVVHGGETVLPAGARGGVVVNVYGDVTGDELVRKVRDAINRTATQNGRTTYV